MQWVSLTDADCSDSWDLRQRKLEAHRDAPTERLSAENLVGTPKPSRPAIPCSGLSGFAQ